MNTAQNRYILTISCPDKVGILAAVSAFLLEQDCKTLESAQFNDEMTGRFFMRTVFVTGTFSPTHEHLTDAFGAIGTRFEMSWVIYDTSVPTKTIIMVSKFGHCLNDLLYRQGIGAFPMSIEAVVSNHTNWKRLTESYDIPFHHLPMTKDTKKEQEAVLLDLIRETDTELLVLARYMQVLSSELCDTLAGGVINIHHSFLPSFKGAKPYHQAHNRGVKMIGATAHYVTRDLDEGPIIDQETARVNHTRTPDQLVAIGRDLENIILARAVRLHCTHRILINNNKTVVFL